jgi:lipoprotein NlpD
MLGTWGRRLSATGMLVLLVGCSSTSLNRAPVEDRTAPVSAASKASVGVPTPVPPPQGFENAGKPGYYTVKPGDTLIRIALDHGQSSQDIARWSQVKNPNRIEVGQVLRIEPPANEAGVVVQPISKPRVVAQSVTAPRAAAATATAPASPAAAAPPAAAPPVAAASAAIDLAWPAQGTVVAGFDEVKNKGLDIAGEAGSPVLAAADGRVVYVGSGLRGYGNLIIIKHDNVFLTAYAHNQTLLVKEDQTVSKGQKIAEMGKSDSDTVKLHFELRRQGKPVDPSKYLASR